MRSGVDTVLGLSEFLKELSSLTDEYGLVIRGCGCCGSPYVQSLEEYIDGSSIFVENLCFDEKTGEYYMRDGE